MPALSPMCCAFRLWCSLLVGPAFSFNRVNENSTSYEAPSSFDLILLMLADDPLESLGRRTEALALAALPHIDDAAVATSECDNTLRFHAAFRGGRTLVHTTVSRLCAKMNELHLPFAIAGGLAAHANGDSAIIGEQHCYDDDVSFVEECWK